LPVTERFARSGIEAVFRRLPGDSEAFRRVSVSFLSHFAAPLGGYWCLSASFANSLTGTPSAVAIPRIVTQDGFPSPRSINESMFGVMPASVASFS
jgi:hypothetical protein